MNFKLVSAFIIDPTLKPTVKKPV